MQIFLKKYLPNVFLVVLSLGVSFLIIELFIFFILDIKPPGYQFERFFIPSFLTGHFHKPNAKGYWYRYLDGTKFHVSVNSYGFADSPRELKKTRPRIALLGDSTTEFWEAEERHRGQYQIENLLDQQFEVLNFGVRAYGTDQTYLLFKNVGVHFNPDVVIYTFCINDIFNNSDTQRKPYFTINPNFSDQLDLQGYPVKFESYNKMNVSFYKYIKDYARQSFIIRNSVPVLRRFKIWHSTKTPIEKHYDLRPYRKASNEEDIKRMKITLGIIAMLNQLARKSGAKFLLVEGVYRPALSGRMHDEIIKAYGPIFNFDKVTSILREFSLKEGIEFLSLQKVVKEQKISAASLMHKEDTMHLNGNGIRLYANSVVTKLRSLGWIPEKKEMPRGHHFSERFKQESGQGR